MDWDLAPSTAARADLDHQLNGSPPAASASQPTSQRRDRPCPRNDIHLLNRIAARDRDAFEVLYYRYAARIMSFLNRSLGPSELHEDIVNDVMLVIWQRAAEFQPTSRLSTWLFGIARRKALEAYRRTSRVPSNPLATWENILTTWETKGEEDNLEDVALETERLNRIKTALNRLPPEQRAALTLAFYHNCSQKEIATRTGYPVSTIKSQVRQGLHRLKALLDNT